MISGVALDPSGKLLATVGDDHLLRVWDLASAQVLFQLGPHADWVRAVALRGDGKILATAGDDRRIRLWEVSADCPAARDARTAACRFAPWPSVPTANCWRRAALARRSKFMTATTANCCANSMPPATISARRGVLARWKTTGRGGPLGLGSALERRRLVGRGRRADVVASDSRVGLFGRRQAIGFRRRRAGDSRHRYGHGEGGCRSARPTGEDSFASLLRPESAGRRRDR